MTSARQIYLGSQSKPALPYDAEVEYLESTGTQWIDCGLPYHSTMSIKGKFTRLGTQYGSIILLATSTTPPLIYCSAMQAAKMVDRFVWRRRGDEDEQSYLYSFTVPYTKEVEYDYDNDALRLDGVVVKSGMVSALNGKASPYYSASNMYMFGIAGSYCSSGRIFYLQIWEGGVLVRDFIPVRFTNELGVSEGAMYDRVSGQLFRNSGTGAFNYGNDK